MGNIPNKPDWKGDGAFRLLAQDAINVQIGDIVESKDLLEQLKAV